MRDSEELAYELFKAYSKYEGVADDCMPEWDQIGEFLQEGYLAEVNAVFEWLFEHGRISSYISAQQLEEASKEYEAYIALKQAKRTNL